MNKVPLQFNTFLIFKHAKNHGFDILKINDTPLHVLLTTAWLNSSGTIQHETFAAPWQVIILS